MAVGFRVALGLSGGSTSSTTVTFNTPASAGNIVAGDIWILTASFRMGSTGTISGVPASFTLIQRLDEGSAVANNTTVSYWYTALGTETAGGALGTITLSAASKWATSTDVFSGCSTASPVDVAGLVSAVAAGATATTGTLAAVAAGQAVFAMAGNQGVALAAPAPTGTNSGAMTAGGSAFTTGGSASSNAAIVTANSLGSVVSQTYAESPAVGAATNTLIAFRLLPPAAASATPPPLVVPQAAVMQAATW